jgi:hypothetical protein
LLGREDKEDIRLLLISKDFKFEGRFNSNCNLLLFKFKLIKDSGNVSNFDK